MADENVTAPDAEVPPVEPPVEPVPEPVPEEVEPVLDPAIPVWALDHLEVQAILAAGETADWWFQLDPADRALRIENLTPPPQVELPEDDPVEDLVVVPELPPAQAPAIPSAPVAPAIQEPPVPTPPTPQRDEAPVAASLQIAAEVLDRLAVQYTGITAASEILKQLGSMSQQVAERQARKTSLDAAIQQANADLAAATQRAAEITVAVDTQASEVVAAVEQMRAQAEIERTQMIEQAAAEAREIVAQANERAEETAGRAKAEVVKAERDLADARALQTAIANSTAEIQIQYDALQAKIEAARARAREAFGG